MATRLEYETKAKCRPEHIWQKFQKLEEWAWWNRVIGEARWLEGRPWEKGSRFLMELVKPRRMRFEPIILECQPPSKVAWIGKGRGVRGEHWFSFELQPEGSTLMRTWEDFSGLPTLFFGKKTKHGIVEMYAAWFEALKFEAERIARDERARA